MRAIILLVSLLTLWTTATGGQQQCGTVYHLFVRNTTSGTEVFLSSPSSPHSTPSPYSSSSSPTTNTTTTTLIPGVYLPPRCRGHSSPCNTTSILTRTALGEDQLGVYVPTEGALLVLTYLHDSAHRSWNITGNSMVATPGGCSPLTIGVGGGLGPTLDILCATGSSVSSLLLDLGTMRFTALDTTAVSGGVSLPVFITPLVNCPQVGVVPNVAVFLTDTSIVVMLFSPTAPDKVFTEDRYDFLTPACSAGGKLEFYQGAQTSQYGGTQASQYENAFLLRCSTSSAFTFDLCRQPPSVYFNHSVSIPYPCSTWELVAYMFPRNGSIIVTFGNGTVTPPISLGNLTDAVCVNPKDPVFVYRHANGSVYAVRIRDSSVTMLGMSQPASSPVPSSRLDLTEHQGSYLVGFFDGSTYKVANLSCLGGSPSVVGVPFVPDLHTSFVGPDQQDCLCSPRGPTLSTVSPTLSPSSPSTSPFTSPSPSLPLPQTQVLNSTGFIIGVSLLAMTAGIVVVVVVVVCLKCAPCRRTDKTVSHHQESGDPRSTFHSVPSFLNNAPHHDGPNGGSITTSSSGTVELEQMMSSQPQCGPGQEQTSRVSVGSLAPKDQTSSSSSGDSPALEQGNGASSHSPVSSQYCSDMPTHSYAPEHSDEESIMAPQEERFVDHHCESLETGCDVLVHCIPVSDVVRQNACGEDKQNDLQQKAIALTTS